MMIAQIFVAFSEKLNFTPIMRGKSLPYVPFTNIFYIFFSCPYSHQNLALALFPQLIFLCLLVIE